MKPLSHHRVIVGYKVFLDPRPDEDLMFRSLTRLAFVVIGLVIVAELISQEKRPKTTTTDRTKDEKATEEDTASTEPEEDDGKATDSDE